MGVFTFVDLLRLTTRFFDFPVESVDGFLILNKFDFVKLCLDSLEFSDGLFIFNSSRVFSEFSSLTAFFSLWLFRIFLMNNKPDPFLAIVPGTVLAGSSSFTISDDSVDL